MEDDEHTKRQNAPQVTPRMVIEVLRGRGTPEEQGLVRLALKDPHSVVHDWLEAMENWAERVFGGQGPSTRAADNALRDTIAKQFHEDLITFVGRKYEEGRLSANELSQILDAGRLPTTDPTDSTAADRQQAAAHMVDIIKTSHPTLAEELRQLERRARGRNSGEGRSP